MVSLGKSGVKGKESLLSIILTSYVCKDITEPEIRVKPIIPQYQESHSSPDAELSYTVLTQIPT